VRRLNGIDCLEIQFGASFSKRNFMKILTLSRHFSIKDNQRLLIGSWF
jgi:hypothetical protein